MKIKTNKKRLKEIQDVYRTLGLESEEYRKYLVALALFPEQLEKKRSIVFIEADINSFKYGELKNARLESTLK